MMSDKKLAEIRARWEACNEGQVRASVGSDRYFQWLRHVAADEQDLLDELAWLRREYRVECQIGQAMAKENMDLRTHLDALMGRSSEGLDREWDLETKVIRYEVERPALLEIVRAVAACVDESDEGGCLLCPCTTPDFFHIDHTADCPVTKARKLLAEGGAA